MQSVCWRQGVQPGGNSFQSSFLLVCCERKPTTDGSFGRVGFDHAHAIAEAVTAVGDEGDDRPTRQIMRQKERADHRRSSHPPDWKPQEDLFIEPNVGDDLLERWPISGFRLCGGLRDGRLVVFRIGRGWVDFEEAGVLREPAPWERPLRRRSETLFAEGRVWGLWGSLSASLFRPHIYKAQHD